MFLPPKKTNSFGRTDKQTGIIGLLSLQIHQDHHDKTNIIIYGLATKMDTYLLQKSSIDKNNHSTKKLEPYSNSLFQIELISFGSSNLASPIIKKISKHFRN